MSTGNEETVFKRPETGSTQYQTAQSFHLTKLESQIRVEGGGIQQTEQGLQQDQGRTLILKNVSQNQNRNTRYQQTPISQGSNESDASSARGEEGSVEARSPTKKEKQVFRDESRIPINFQPSEPKNKLSYIDINEKYFKAHHSSVTKKAVCGCFRIKKTEHKMHDAVQQLIINKGQEPYSLVNEEHKQMVDSIYYWLTKQKLTLEEYTKFSQGFIIFFQLFQFLSCIEFYNPHFSDLLQRYGRQIIEHLMKIIGHTIFDLLRFNKLSGFFEKYKNDEVVTLLRNLQMGIFLYVLNEKIKEQKQFPDQDQIQYPDLDQILKSVAKQPNEFYQYWIKKQFEN